MLFAFRASSSKLVDANAELVGDGPHVCPHCNEAVTLRKSRVRLNHFAHKPASRCSFGGLESPKHRACKLAIHNALTGHHAVRNSAMERSLTTCRPDVSARIRGVPVAVEVQASKVSISTLVERTSEYRRRGIYVLWLLLWNPYLEGQRYLPPKWEQWLHALYSGRVYYWRQGLSIESYGFEPRRERVSERKWFTKDGRVFKMKKHTRVSKRSVIPLHRGTFDLVKDFAPRKREPGASQEFLLPKSLLFMEKLPPHETP
jgi:competence protein CoiA